MEIPAEILCKESFEMLDFNNYENLALIMAVFGEDPIRVMRKSVRK